MRSIIIASTSTIHGSGYLEYLLEELKVHFKTVNEILFIPYARPGGISHSDYTAIAAKAFKTIGKTVKGIHEFDSAEDAIKQAEGIFVGGGNTFVLVSQLYKNNALTAIKNAVNSGTPYLGTSAGSNICGLTMHTTNDMPIMYPPSFKTIGLVPFNINPHYLDPIAGSTHMGETRETRIKEFHTYNTQPVIGLREGSWIKVSGKTLTLKGTLEARIFEQGKAPYEIASNSNLEFLK
ncbi:dipeptidase PepE [Winogradskyella endarachnes]|uniref:Dipeptidase PepE n=1 Tax=Winogradskyella endarachnes TaxID=2681965 RepID=A0A6L6UB22_9FLAO|nr:dipeptidase PepE [Winogradskyella endarachnes]MUU77944.1 dipeptidase PepE [Winogradskyella endarachnes]